MGCKQPSVTITMQPADTFRFRYQSELEKGRSLGSIGGACGPSRETGPSIRIDGYKGHCLVLLTLINSRNNLVHPHAIYGKAPGYKCREGVVCLITDRAEAEFRNIGIICVRGKSVKDVTEALQSRKKCKIDPFGAGFAHINDHSLIDMFAVRLCFQVFLRGKDWTSETADDPSKYDRSLTPVASTVIRDAKKCNVIKIVYITYCAGPVSGGTEMHLWCDKYSGEKPEVVFEDERKWTQVATEVEYHRQCAIRFKAPVHPKYSDPNYTGDLKVKVYLRQKIGEELVSSKHASAEYVAFTPKGGSGLLSPTPPDYLKDIDEKKIDDKWEPLKQFTVNSPDVPYATPSTSRTLDPVQSSSASGGMILAPNLVGVVMPTVMEDPYLSPETAPKETPSSNAPTNSDQPMSTSNLVQSGPNYDNTCMSCEQLEAIHTFDVNLF